jgi:hypothetical protein
MGAKTVHQLGLIKPFNWFLPEKIGTTCPLKQEDGESNTYPLTIYVMIEKEFGDFRAHLSAKPGLTTTSISSVQRPGREVHCKNAPIPLRADSVQKIETANCSDPLSVMRHGEKPANHSLLSLNRCGRERAAALAQDSQFLFGISPWGVTFKVGLDTHFYRKLVQPLDFGREDGLSASWTEVFAVCSRF